MSANGGGIAHANRIRRLDGVRGVWSHYTPLEPLVPTEEDLAGTVAVQDDFEQTMRCGVQQKVEAERKVVVKVRRAIVGV